MSNPIETAPTSAEPTKNEGDFNKTPRGRRGKGSQQRNQDKFREEKGRQWMAENQKRLNAKLGDLDELTKLLEKVQVKPTSVAKQLPITTRGLGIATAEMHKIAQAKQPDPCTVYSLYRASLAQFEVQVRRSAQLDREMETYPKPAKQDCEQFITQEQTVLSRSKNFQPIAAIINSYGHFAIHSTAYHPYIPLPFIRPQELVIVEEPVTKTKAVEGTSGAPDPVPVVKRYAARKVGSGFVPDPYVVTLSNLRNTVNYLANPYSDVEIREYFQNRNPLPGARWSVEHLLTNPRDFVPDRFDHQTLKRDLDYLENWLARFKGKVGYAVGSCNFDGKGNSSQIVMARSGLRLENSDSDYWLGAGRDGEDYHALEHIPDPTFYLGVLSLHGEYPDDFHRTDGLEMRPPAIYASRHHSLAAYQIAVDWDTVFQAAVKR